MDDVAAKHLRPTSVRSKQRRQHPDKRRLPRAVRPQQAKDRSLLDIQIDPSKRRRRPKTLDHTLDMHRRISHHSHSEMTRADRRNWRPSVRVVDGHVIPRHTDL